MKNNLNTETVIAYLINSTLPSVDVQQICNFIKSLSPKDEPKDIINDAGTK